MRITIEMKKVLVLPAILIIAGCAVQVQSLYDPDVDFSKYETFCWLKGCEFTYTGPNYMNDSIIKARIQDAIVEELVSKGLKQNDDSPDLLVDFHITFEEETAIIYHEDYEDDYDNFINEDDMEYRDYLKGTLIIDIVDKEESRMVWRSAAVRYMDINPELTEANIRKGIARALKDFPPQRTE